MKKSDKGDKKIAELVNKEVMAAKRRKLDKAAQDRIDHIAEHCLHAALIPEVDEAADESDFSTVEYLYFIRQLAAAFMQRSMQIVSTYEEFNPPEDIPNIAEAEKMQTTICKQASIWFRHNVKKISN